MVILASVALLIPLVQQVQNEYGGHGKSQKRCCQHQRQKPDGGTLLPDSCFRGKILPSAGRRGFYLRLGCIDRQLYRRTGFDGIVLHVFLTFTAKHLFTPQITPAFDTIHGPHPHITITLIVQQFFSAVKGVVGKSYQENGRKQQAIIDIR